MPDPRADTLRRAADIIRQRGWVRGEYEDPDTGAVCAMGALRIADGARAEDYGMNPIGLDAVSEVLRNRGLDGSLIDFNDFNAESVDDVIGVIEEAAKLAEAGVA